MYILVEPVETFIVLVDTCRNKSTVHNDPQFCNGPPTSQGWIWTNTVFTNSEGNGKSKQVKKHLIDNLSYSIYNYSIGEGKYSKAASNR